MDNKRFIEIVTRYLSNEATIDEFDQLQLLLKKKEYRSIYQTIKKKWDKYEEPPTDIIFNAARGLVKLKTKINKYEPDFDWLDEKKTFPHYKYGYTWLRVAASIAILTILTFSALYIFGVFTTQTPKITMNDKITNPGEKSILTFFDGTKVTINAKSKLRYPSSFDKKEREVYLEGEAYFEVAHNPSVPFIVHTGNISTIVLGTKFNVNAYLGENQLSVSLVEGSVKVQKEDGKMANSTTILKPNEQLVYNKRNDKSSIEKFDIQVATGWKDNILKFDKESLDKIFTVLSRSYGVDFELTDTTYENHLISANFDNESFWTVVKVIKKLTGLNYEIFEENNKITKIVFFKKR